MVGTERLVGLVRHRLGGGHRLHRLVDLTGGRYGVEYLRGAEVHVKWFHSLSRRARWVQSHDGRVWISRTLYRRLPTVKAGHLDHASVWPTLRQKG